jgi:hypothetical protein
MEKLMYPHNEVIKLGIKALLEELEAAHATIKTLEAERDLWMTRTASLVANLPPQMVAGEPLDWAEIHNEKIRKQERERFTPIIKAVTHLRETIVTHEINLSKLHKEL